MRMRRTTSVLALLAAGGWLAAMPVMAKDSARGVVFEDRNGNRARDAGEPGIAGVLVSNGREVVVTDADGAYSIGVDKETIVFITKPANYMTPVNDHMLPQFYYIHQPDGTPAELGLRYPGIDPTGPLPEAIDFPLLPRAEPERFSVILISDPQPQTQAEVDFIRDTLVPELVGTDAAFGITTGDIMFDDLSFLPRYNGIIAQIGVPWYNVPGNHELNFLSPDDHYSLETFKRIYGPPYYGFDYGGAHFIVLDNVDYLGRDAGRDEPTYRGNGMYEGRIAAAQLAWLEAHLAQVPEDKPLVVTMHIPLRWPLNPDQASMNTVNREELFRLLSGRKVFAAAGHTHTAHHVYFGAEDGFAGAAPLHHQILATVSGSWWSGPMDVAGIPYALQRDGVPNGYHILEVDGTELTTRYKALRHPDDFQMRIVFDKTFHHHTQGAQRDYRHGQLLNGTLLLDEVPSTRLVVNVFDGGPTTVASFAVGDHDGLSMERITGFDPFANELFLRFADVKKPWVFRDNRPGVGDRTDSLFVASLPRDLAPGLHTVTVRATDEFGREHVAHAVLEIVGHGGAAMTAGHLREGGLDFAGRAERGGTRLARDN